MVKNLKNYISLICLVTITLAGSVGKSHSVELLHWGRHTPISLGDNLLVTANSFIYININSIYFCINLIVLIYWKCTSNSC